MPSHKLFKHLKKMWHVSIYRYAFGMWLVMEDLHQVAEDSFVFVRVLQTVIAALTLW